MENHYRSAQRKQLMNTTLSRLGVSVLAAFISPALLAANLNALDVAALPATVLSLGWRLMSLLPCPVATP